MRGSIRQKGKNSWQLQVYTGPGSDGKPRRHFETVRGKKGDAQRRLREVLSSLDNGTYMKPSKTTLGEYLERWLNAYAMSNLSPRGYERYRDIIRAHFKPAIGNLLLNHLQVEHLQSCYANWLKQGLSAGTVRYHHAVIHKALQDAVEWRLLVRNVADAVKPPPKQSPDMQTWNEYELARFLDAARDSQYYELFYLDLFTGMRRSELLALRWQDIDFILGQVYVNRGLHQLKDGSYVFTPPKSAKSRRTIALTPSTILVLREYYRKKQFDAPLMGKQVADRDLVFGTPEGKPLRPNTITRAWTMLAAKADVKPIRLHDARHTHASLMLKQGIHPKIVQERLGHSSIQITLDTYSHVAPGLQEAAAQSFDALVQNKNNASLTPKVDITLVKTYNLAST
jgi:integrase